LRDVDCGMWNTEYELRKGRATSLMAGCGLRDVEYGMWNTEYELRNMSCAKGEQLH